MKITLKKLHIENFKNAKDQTFELDHITMADVYVADRGMEIELNKEPF